MSTKYLERLLVECKTALVELDVMKQPKNSKTRQAYLKVVGQLESKCGTCGDLMDSQNCCVMDVKLFKMYHPGCEPSKPKPVEQPKKQISDSDKLDAILSMVWQMKEQK